MTFRTYIGNRTKNGDFRKVHDFLVETNNTEYTYARFDWMMTNWDYLEDQYLERIGIWEQDGKIVAAVLFDHSLDLLFPIVLPGYEHLYREMYDYAKKYMVKEDDSGFSIYVRDTNTMLQNVLKKNGMIATEEKEAVSLFDLSEEIPEAMNMNGFALTSLDESKDYMRYMKCLFNGFGHGENGEVFSFTQEDNENCKNAYECEYVNLSLKIFAKSTDGSYVAHAGLWYDRKSKIAVVEPVCTVPDYRKMGLGKAALYEGLRRVKALGAEYAAVGSGQQFYYSLGFVPYSTGTIWKPTPHS